MLQEAQRKPIGLITKHLKKKKNQLELVRHNSNHYRKYMEMFINFMRWPLFLQKNKKMTEDMQNIGYQVQDRMVIQYDLAVFIKIMKFLDDFETTIAKLSL